MSVRSWIPYMQRVDSDGVTHTSHTSFQFDTMVFKHSAVITLQKGYKNNFEKSSRSIESIDFNWSRADGQVKSLSRSIESTNIWC